MQRELLAEVMVAMKALPDTEKAQAPAPTPVEGFPGLGVKASVLRGSLQARHGLTIPPDFPRKQNRCKGSLCSPQA